ncbi:hypothetical protein C7388_10517 [Methylobacterium radiotolerans]|nr:hypothetical protein C7388_10517 [Methylobacterium organophilum]
MAREAFPRTRAEARKVGAAFGCEVAQAISRAILDCPDGERTEAFIDALLAPAMSGMEAAAEHYSAEGVPLLLVMRFKTSFLRTLRDRTALMRLAAMAAGPAN